MAELLLFTIVNMWLLTNIISYWLFGSYFFTISFGQGKSMKPSMPGGIKAYLQYYPVTLEEGDIVSYYNEDKIYVCHRIIAIDNDEIELRGDNNTWSDGWYKKDDISAKVLSIRGRPLYIPLSPRAVYDTILKIKTLK